MRTRFSFSLTANPPYMKGYAGADYEVAKKQRWDLIMLKKHSLRLLRAYKPTGDGAIGFVYSIDLPIIIIVNCIRCSQKSKSCSEREQESAGKLWFDEGCTDYDSKTYY